MLKKEKKIFLKRIMLLITLVIGIIMSCSVVSKAVVKDISVLKYKQNGEYITRIKAETKVSDFLNAVILNEGEQKGVYNGAVAVAPDALVTTGSQLKLDATNIYTLVIRGDITCDGKLSATDLSKLKQHATGLSELEGAKLKAGDINYSDQITTLDVAQLKMLLVGLDVPDPADASENIIVTPDTTAPAKKVNLTIAAKDGVKYSRIKYSTDGGMTYNVYSRPLELTENVKLNIKLVVDQSYEAIEPTDKFNVDTDVKNDNESYEEYITRLTREGKVKVVNKTEEIPVGEKIYVVNNIDTIAPNAFEFTAGKTTNSITVTADATDTMRDYTGNIVSNGIAGIAKYLYKLNDGEWQESNLFEKLTKNTTYTISVKAVDYAGNETNATNNGLEVTTEDVSIANLSIVFTPNNSTYTNEDVEVVMSCAELEGTPFKIQYQINGTTGEWLDGDKCVAKGNCIIYARIADSTNQEGTGAYATFNVTNIDKVAPKDFKPEILTQTTTAVKVRATVEDGDATETSCKSGIASYTYNLMNENLEDIVKEEKTTNEYEFTGLDTTAHGYYIAVIAKDNAGNSTVSEIIKIGQTNNNGLGIDVINPGPDHATVNGGDFKYFNPVIPVGFKAVNTDDASWEGDLPKDWNKGLVIEDKDGNQFVWVPVDGEAVKYLKGMMVWDCGNAEDWARYNSQIKGDQIPKSLEGIEEEISQIEKYEGFYVSRYEAGNDNNTLGSKNGLKVVNGVTHEESRYYAESMYRLAKVKSGLLTGTMWDTMTKWIANEKGEDYVTNNINSGNTYETAFTFSGTYATGPNSTAEKRSEYITGTNVNKEAKTRTLLTTGIVDQFKAKNIYDTAGNVWEYTSEYLVNEDNKTQFIARGGNYYWVYDKIVAAGTAVREFVSELEGEERNEGGFRVALYLTDEPVSEVGVIEDFNRTIDGNPATSTNPVIPAGFAAVNKGGLWGDGRTPAEYDKGLVIEDGAGNQFVWVPVDGTDVKYEKWTTTGISHAETGESYIPSKVTAWGETEETQVQKYGGYYIARYESSLAADEENIERVQTQADKDVVVNRNYTEMQTLAETMKTIEKVETIEGADVRTAVATGIITGKQWDTVMSWIANEKNSAAVLENSEDWGTYGTSLSKTGTSVAKNIYDLAGNAWEMTGETFNTNDVIYRGGVYSDNTIAAAYRGSKTKELTDKATGFRMALYVTGPVQAQTRILPIQPDEALNGTKGLPVIPSANGNVTVTPSTTNWTNQNVTVGMANAKPEYILQYQVNGTDGKWTKGNSYTAEQNGTVYVRLANSKGQGGEPVKYTVGNIDKVVPNEFTPGVAGLLTNTIAVVANTADNLSGIAKYVYYINGQYAGEGGNSYIISGLAPQTTFSIFVDAYDNAGNVRRSNTISATTLSGIAILKSGDYVTTYIGGKNRAEILNSYAMFEKKYSDCRDNEVIGTLATYQILEFWVTSENGGFGCRVEPRLFKDFQVGVYQYTGYTRSAIVSPYKNSKTAFYEGIPMSTYPTIKGGTGTVWDPYVLTDNYAWVLVCKGSNNNNNNSDDDNGGEGGIDD